MEFLFSSRLKSYYQKANPVSPNPCRKNTVAVCFAVAWMTTGAAADAMLFPISGRGNGRKCGSTKIGVSEPASVEKQLPPMQKRQITAINAISSAKIKQINFLRGSKLKLKLKHKIIERNPNNKEYEGTRIRNMKKFFLHIKY